MFKNRAGQYTVQESYDYAQTLARIWKITLLTHLAFIVILALSVAFTVKAYSDSIITSANFEKISGHSNIGDIIAGFIVFELVTLLVCALLQATLDASRAFKLSWPIWTAGAFSLFSGILFMNVGASAVRSFYSFSKHFDEDAGLHDRLAEGLTQKELDQVYDLLLWYSFGCLIFVVIMTILAFMAGVCAVLALLETRKRRVLAAKTLKEVFVREYDGLHSSRESVNKIVESNLAAGKYTEQERLGIAMRVEKALKTSQTYIIYEGKKAVGFLTRSHDYREILELWVEKESQRKRFGQVLVLYYLNIIRENHTEMPIRISVPSNAPSVKLLLSSMGWRESKEGPSVLIYDEPQKSLFE